MQKEIKKRLLKNGTYKEYMKQKKHNFYNGIADYIEKDNKKIRNYDAYNNISKEDIDNCERIRKARHEQTKKIEKHINYLFNRPDYDLFFMTFTFTDEILNNTKPNTRRENISRLLKNVCDDYILNIDYGKTTNREHYHAVIALKKDKYNKYYDDEKYLKIKELDTYKYGYYGALQIKKEMIDSIRLSKYMTKLVLHSVKVNQAYVSVKKGTDYQEYKTLINKQYDYNHNFPRNKLKKIKEIAHAIDKNTHILDKRLKELFNGNIEIIEE